LVAYLTVSENNVGEEGAGHLANTLKVLKNLKQLSLSLQLANIILLNIRNLKSIGDRGFALLGDALKYLKNTLAELSLNLGYGIDSDTLWQRMQLRS